jgi:hypothetical protein
VSSAAGCTESIPSNKGGASSPGCRSHPTLGRLPGELDALHLRLSAS